MSKRLICEILAGASLLLMAVASSALANRDTGSFSVACLTNDIALQSAEGLTTGSPAATVTISPASLWPPNHKFRNVNISMSLPSGATNLASPVDVSLTVNDITDDQVTQDDGGGAGCGKPSARQGADWSPTDFTGLVQSGALQLTTDSVSVPGVELRAERCAKLGTRTYEVSVTCCDITNSVCDTAPEVLDVTVPKSRGHGHL